jgi:hypothetical protein
MTEKKQKKKDVPSTKSKQKPEIKTYRFGGRAKIEAMKIDDRLQI